MYQVLYPLKKELPKSISFFLPLDLHKILKYKYGHLEQFFPQLWEMNGILKGSVFWDEMFFSPICGLLQTKERCRVNEYYGRNMSSCCNRAPVTVGTGKQGLAPLGGPVAKADFRPRWK